jgi:hypothetical protein
MSGLYGIQLVFVHLFQNFLRIEKTLSHLKESHFQMIHKSTSERIQVPMNPQSQRLIIHSKDLLNQLTMIVLTRWQQISPQMFPIRARNFDLDRTSFAVAEILSSI